MTTPPRCGKRWPPACGLRLPPLDLVASQDVSYITEAESEVRQAAARNPNCSPVLAASLARRVDPTVRAAAASNPNLPVAALERLVADIDPTVRAAAAAPAAGVPVLFARLAGDPAARVRAAAARHATSVDAAGLLADDLEPDVVEALASNPACPAVALVRVAARRDKTGRRLVGLNPNCPPGLSVWLRG